MKPITITFSAFGPFPREHSIDFARLGHHGLFLITGPTGAGKTTVLDAMVFALYGEAAGARGKHSDRLRSDFAAPETPTSVTLEFEIRGRRFHIVRTPTYFRPKQRGEGITKETGSVTLSEYDGTGWKPLGTKIREVDALVAELIGLDADQFQQVILLPQGRFAEVLRADSKERLKLLRALFGTGRFLDAVEILRQESNRRTEAVKDARREVDRLFEDVLEDWCEVIAQAGDDAAIELGIEFDEDDNPYAPETMNGEALDALAEQATAMVAGLELAAKTANTAYDAAKRTADEAEATAARWARRAELVGEQTKLAASADADARRGPELERAVAANDLVATIRTTEDARRSEQTARAAADEAASAIAASTGADAVLDAQRVAALIDDQRAIETAARTAIAEFTTAADERAKQRTARDDADRLERDRDQLRAELERVEGELPERRTAAQAAETAASGVAASEAAANAAEDHRAAVDRGITLDRQIAQLDDRIAVSKTETEAAHAALTSARARHISGLAARLASELAPGAECPTCGSTDHPHLAEAPADAASEDDVAGAETTYEGARTAHDDLVRERATLAATRSELPPADALDEATERAATARETLAAQRALAADADTRRGDVAAAERFVADNAPKVLTLTEAAATATAQSDAAGKAADGAEGRANAFSPDVATAEQRLADATATIAALRTYDDRLRDVAEAAAAHAAQRQALDDALSAKGFADDAAATAAAMDPAALAAERTELDERAERRRTIVTLLAELAKEPLPDEQPDPTALIEARDTAEALRDDAVAAHGTANVAATRIAGARARLGGRLAEVDDAIAAAETAKTVYDVASGNAAPKVALESWVCSAYLERVTRQANHHLVAMTGGQYRLEIGRTTDGRKQGGLDLDVFDLHTGATRSVDTLSGGETFMASLSLALGLAEVVAGQQNLMLDALFIDEGFGSLDAETLDRATEVLHGLQTAGRMVGVITHVTEMQRSLPTGLAVTKTEQGSTLTVEYPDA